VQLKRSGLAFDLPTDRPLLQALEEAGQTPAFGCRRGICNTCSCDRIAGATRDLQSGELRDEPSTPIRLCVHSAAQGLVLDL
jgi:ferredoxin